MTQPASWTLPSPVKKAMIDLCTAVQQVEPVWERLTGRSPSANALLLVDGHFQGVFNMLSEAQSKARTLLTRDLQPSLAILDLAVTQVSDMLLLSDTWASSNDDELIPLITNLANSLIGVRELLYVGLAGQAAVLLRAFFEIGDLTLAVCGDPETREAYKAVKEDAKASFQTWRKQLSPEVLRRIISKMERTFGLDSRLSEIMLFIRRSIYQDLSAFAHGNRGTILRGSYAQDSDDSEKLALTWGGYFNREMSISVVRYSVVSAFNLLLMLKKLLLHHRGWKLNPNDIIHVGYLYRWEVFQSAFLNICAEIDNEV